MPRKTVEKAAPAAKPAAKVYSRPLSHSSISMYLECPQKFKLKYVDKLPELPKWFFSFGQSVHKALEFFYSIPALPAPTLERLLQEYKDGWLKAGYKDAEQEREYLEDGERILREFYAKNIKTFKLPLFAEYKFELEVEGVPLLGFVDRIDKLDNGKLHILDYKTGKAIPKERLQADRQLTMYQLAVEKLIGAEVESLTFYHLPTNKELTVGPRAAAQIDALKDTIVTVNDGIQASRFDPTPDEGKCRWCDFKPHCPAFRPGFYGAPLPAPAKAAPAAQPDLPGGLGDSAKLAELVDRYGDALANVKRLESDAQALREEIAAILGRNGYVRAFGSRFEVSAAAETRWEIRDRVKLLEVLKRHGLYEATLKPAAPEVYRLLDDPKLPLEARRDLEALAEKKQLPGLSLKPLSEGRA
ncbi:MAG: PD-(D/E)XK nuclease family protein [Elusimicrobia bacterium]|nr:PD-(D/E)XK nuclease family protein [Elusimicrobiota bacterium]